MSWNIFTHLAVQIIIMLLIPMTSMAQPSAEAGSRGSPKEVVEEIERLLGHQSLNLTRDVGNNSISRYYYVIECFSSASGIRVKTFDVVVARNGDRSALLVRFADGLPFCYLTDGMAAFLDTDVKGLRVFSGGRPRIVLRAEPKGFGFEMSHRELNKPTEFLFDLSSLLTQAKAASNAFFDRGTKSLRFVTEKAFVSIQFNLKGEPGRFPIELVIVQGKNGNEMQIGGFDISGTPPLDLFSLTIERLKATGLLVSAVKDEEMSKFSLFPKTNAPADAGVRAAAVTWERLFIPKLK